MNPSDTEVPESRKPAALSPKLPVIWIGYLLGVATIVAEFAAVSLNPELAKQGGIPPLYLFLVSFIGGVYWFVCIYRYHVILAHVPGWTHPISPARAVGLPLHPILQFLLGLQMADGDREVCERTTARSDHETPPGRHRHSRSTRPSDSGPRVRTDPALFSAIVSVRVSAPRFRRTVAGRLECDVPNAAEDH